jgi:hypothetical protein
LHLSVGYILLKIVSIRSFKMPRLPQPGGDAGTWGSVLNDFLNVSHNSDGTIKASAISNKADDSSVVHIDGDQTVSGTKTFSSSPTVPSPAGGNAAVNKDYVDSNLSSKEPLVAAGTSGQYYRGDKTWQILDKTAVGLGSVDNTSDANKPVSAATQTQLNTKISASDALALSVAL